MVEMRKRQFMDIFFFLTTILDARESVLMECLVDTRRVQTLNFKKTAEDTGK